MCVNLFRAVPLLLAEICLLGPFCVPGVRLLGVIGKQVLERELVPRMADLCVPGRAIFTRLLDGDLGTASWLWDLGMSETSQPADEEIETRVFGGPA